MRANIYTFLGKKEKSQNFAALVGLVQERQEREKGKIMGTANSAQSLTFKTFECMQYLEHYDTDDLNVIADRIKSLTQVKTWCLNLHDKDRRDDGSAKPPHFHAVVTLSSVMTVKSIAEALHLEPQYINKIRSTTKSAQIYLVHRNNPEKYQYDPNDVLANFSYVDLVDGLKPKLSREEISARIDSGEIKRYNLPNFITIDEYGKNKLYYERCFEYRQQKMRKVDRNMECIYITGKAGSGKTTFAKHLAQNKGFAVYVSSGGKNPLDNYAGEECIILDDIRGSTMPISDFLKLTDNHTDSLVGCRYYNKSIAECRLLIVTSVHSLEKLYQGVAEAELEPLKQLRRRFAVTLRVTKEIVAFYGYIEERDKYEFQCQMENPARLYCDKEYAKQKAKAFLDSFGLTALPDPLDELDPLDLEGDSNA